MSWCCDLVEDLLILRNFYLINKWWYILESLMDDFLIDCLVDLRIECLVRVLLVVCGMDRDL